MALNRRNREIPPLLTLAALAALLAACASTDTHTPVPVVDMARSQREIPRYDGLEQLLSYAVQLRGSGAEALQREYARVSGNVTRDPTAMNRVQLAILLSLPNAPFQDTARARKQLEQVVSEAEQDVRPYRQFARYLLAALNDRRQYEGALADERRQRQELQQKLEQLKAIEQETGTRISPQPLQEN